MFPEKALGLNPLKKTGGGGISQYDSLPWLEDSNQKPSKWFLAALAVLYAI